MTFGRKLFFILLTLSLHQSALFAEDTELLTDPLVGIQVSKAEIMQSLETLRKDGKISEADYEKTKAELATMSDDKISTIKDSAINIIRKDPDKALELVNGKKINVDEVSKQMNESTKP